MNAFPASVRNLAEDAIAFRAGADWIDLKEPGAGALGAVAIENVEQVVDWVGLQHGTTAVSATIGDCWETPELMPERVRTLHGVGVGYAKTGVFAAAPSAELLATVSECCHLGQQIISVCFAEEPSAPQDIATFVDGGVAGVMLDTTKKAAVGLRDLMSMPELAIFVEAARLHDILCGLAGSLALSDISALGYLRADYLGFRGALCDGSKREGGISFIAASAIRDSINALPVDEDDIETVIQRDEYC